MIYFFDNNFTPKIARMLSALGVETIHLQDRFAANAPDVEWLSEAGKHGWVVLTGDARIRKRLAERKALQEARIIAVIVHKGFPRLNLWDQALWIVKHWRKIAEAVETARPATTIRVSGKGKIEYLP